MREWHGDDVVTVHWVQAMVPAAGETAAAWPEPGDHAMVEVEVIKRLDSRRFQVQLTNYPSSAFPIYRERLIEMVAST